MLLWAIVATSCTSPASQSIVAQRPKPHPFFTTVVVSQLRPGLAVSDIRAVFGDPDSVRSSMCGTPERGNWPCLILEYDMQSYKHNRFYFMMNVPTSEPLLNHWYLDVVYP